ncbi:hypothetical protein P280DRAFT_475062 [Massarina eburnea CBS 473.64]|uniref:Uncharacterized protein n=1 Tax=Massarina eburnea CBS 473.64 TaxID=1395130 RepID=A0A6A6SE60_9PLEO|nr:hypothetical protein P280DRAFT_475062 [Massarina eburnea CBS 473.64]
MEISTSRNRQPYLEVNNNPSFIKLVKQEETTSQFLEPPELQTETPPQAFTGYDHGDVRVLGGDYSGGSDSKSKTSTAVFWKGRSFYALTWDFPGIILSSCFLGEPFPRLRYNSIMLISVALGVCVTSLKDKPENAWSNRIIEATRIAPSIWPIIFSNTRTAIGFPYLNSRLEPTIRALYASTLYNLDSSIQYVDPTLKAARDVISVLGGEVPTGIQTSTDNWGNVRIPNHRYLSNYNSSDRHRWLEPPWDKKILNYSSLLDDRVEGVNRTFTGNTSFTIASSYHDFNCSPWFYLNTMRLKTSNGTYGDSEADI